MNEDIKKSIPLSNATHSLRTAYYAFLSIIVSAKLLSSGLCAWICVLGYVFRCGTPWHTGNVVISPEIWNIAKSNTLYQMTRESYNFVCKMGTRLFRIYCNVSCTHGRWNTIYDPNNHRPCFSFNRSQLIELPFLGWIKFYQVLLLMVLAQAEQNKCFSWLIDDYYQ